MNYLHVTTIRRNKGASKSIKSKNNTKTLSGITVAGGNGFGNGLNQVDGPHGIFIDNDQSIYIADYWNHRIVQYKSDANNGQIIAGGNGQGNQNEQLNQPTDIIVDNQHNSLIIADAANRRVIQWFHQNQQILISDIDCWGLTMDKNGYIYICDCVKNEVRRWKQGDTEGILVAGGNGKGDHLNQLNYPTYIFIDNDYSLYISDYCNHRVMKWKQDVREGIVVAGGNDQGNSLKQLSYPRGVTVDHLRRIYVCDSENHRVMRWCEGDVEGSIVVGGNEAGEESNQLNAPNGLSLDSDGNLYVVDQENHRVQKYEIN